MEIEELKEAWIALDNRLKRDEKLKESIILEMMKSKAGKLVNRFIIYEIIAIVVALLVIPVCVYWLNSRGGKYLITDITMFFALAICFFGSIWCAIKLHDLMKFDFAKNVGNNIYYVNRYNIQIKREKKIFWYFVWPTITILVVLSYASMKVKLSLWTLLICLIAVATLVSYWSYKYYDKGINSILRSLEEIRELKEE